MSNTQTLNPAAAQAVLVNEVYRRPFFEKLAADYGRVPQSDEEAIGYLELAQHLRKVNAQIQNGQQQKAASLVQQANRALAPLTGLAAQDTRSKDWAIKQAAARLALDPTLGQAFCTVRLAQAHQAILNRQGN